jgi:hypothetical protein
MRYLLNAIEKNLNFVMLLNFYINIHLFIHIFQHLGLYKFYVCQYITTKQEKVLRLCFLLENEECCTMMPNFHTTAQHTESARLFKCKISIQ